MIVLEVVYTSGHQKVHMYKLKNKQFNPKRLNDSCVLLFTFACRLFCMTTCHPQTLPRTQCMTQSMKYI